MVGTAKVFSSESVALNTSIASTRAREVGTAELIVPTLSRDGDNGPTEKPGTILTRARVPGAARDFFFFSQSQIPLELLLWLSLIHI